MTDLLVIVPTRGRPERFVEFVATWGTTASGTARLLACLDEDDPRAADYPPIPTEIGFYWVSPRNGFAPRLSAEALAAACSDDPPYAIASFGDDHLPRTPGWDRLMLDAAHDLGSGVLYPNDLLQREALPTAPIITSDIVRALGWYSPPGIEHMYVDNWWRALGIGLERLRYLPDIIVEHMHPSAVVAGGPDWVRKAEWDDTYESSSNRDASVADLTAWETYRCGPEIVRDIQRARDAIGAR